MFLSIQNYRRGRYTFTDPSNQQTNVYSEPIQQKWLPNDRIDPNTKEVVDRAPHRNIVGIVDFVNRTGQGFSPRGVPLYLFHPINPSYPPMIVASKTKYAINQLVAVNIEQWTEKWPRAGIQTILGPVGNKEYEQEAIIRTMSITKKLESLQEDDSDIRRHVPFKGFVCHIDPEGCEDVDDILLWNEQDGCIDFGIGIADVASFVTEECTENEYAQRLGQTVYVDGKPIYPMLSPTLSTQKASLRSDQQERPVLTLVFTIRDGKVVNERWEQYLVRVQKTYSYESVYEDTEVAEKVKRYLEIVSHAGDIGLDSHHWIEVAMVLYNTAAAKVLKNHNVGIFRSQTEGRSQDEWASLANTTGCKELAFFGYGSGTYVYAKEPELRHKGLNLELYCHASSPLRRYVDLYNQRWLKSILFKTSPPTQIANVEYLNRRNQLAKTCDRNLWFVKHLHAGQLTEVEGFVLKQKIDTYTLYVPIWKRKIYGKPTKQKEFTIGQAVHIRAFTDVRIPSLEERVVCSFS